MSIYHGTEGTAPVGTAIVLDGTAVVTPGKPMISGRIGSITSPTVGKVPFDEFWVSGRGITYDSGTRRFTVPRDGVYRITFDPFWHTLEGGQRMVIGLNTDTPSANNNIGHTYESVAQHTSGSINTMIQLSAGDYIVFYIVVGTLYNSTTDRFNTFSIEYIS